MFFFEFIKQHDDPDKVATDIKMKQFIYGHGLMPQASDNGEAVGEMHVNVYICAHET